MNIQDPVICEQKTGRHQTCDNCLLNGPIACSRLKIVSMNRKYHNHKLQTNPWHCEEESQNNHETQGRQTKQRKPALNTASCDEKHSTTAYRGIIMFHNIKKSQFSIFILNPGRHTYKAFFSFSKVDSNDWFQKCTVKQAKQEFLTLKY